MLDLYQREDLVRAGARMIRIRILIFALLFALLGSPIAAIASDVTNALYSGTIVISNNSTVATNVATVANISTQNLIDGGYLNSTANNTVIRNSSGADVPFMPAYTPSSDFWCMWVPSIGADSYLTYILYTANSVGGEIRYFPASGGMTIVDNASLELGLVDFSLNLTNTLLNAASGFDMDIIDKFGSFRVAATGTEGITAGTIPLAHIDITPNTITAWVDIDVSDYVPIGATGVILQINANGSDVGIRKNGSTDARNMDYWHGWAMIGIDANAVFEAYVQDAAVEIYLEGYTDESWTFFTNGVDKSFAGPGVWTDVDVSVECPGALGVVVECVETGVGNADIGLRMEGSADNRVEDIWANEHFFAVIGVDGSQIFEGWIGNNSVDFYIAGYVTAGSTFKVNADDKSIAAVGVWTDIDCSTEAPNATFIFLETICLGVSPGNRLWGLRTDGSSDDIYDDYVDHNWGVVACDESQVIEGEISQNIVDFYLVGYATSGVHFPFTNMVRAQSVSTDEYEASIYRDDEPAMPLWASDVVVGVNMGSGILPVKIIEEQTLTAPAASVTFSGIAGNVSLWDSLAGVTSRHLVVMVNAANPDAVNSRWVLVRFNGDSGNNYNVQFLGGSGVGASAFAETNVTSGRLFEITGTNYANAFDGGVSIIPHAFNTSNHKVVLSLGGAAERTVSTIVSRWASINAITSITLTIQGGNASTGSTFLLGVVDERYLVEEQLLAVDGVIDFQNITGTGHDLVVVGYSQSDAAAVEDEIQHEFNNDAHGVAYPTQEITGRGAVRAAAQPNFEIGMTSGDNAPVNEFGALLATYSQYAEATNQVHYTSLSGYHESTIPTSEVRAMSGRWATVNPITRLEYYPNGGALFKVGSLFSLYRVPRYVIDRQELTAVAPTITFNNIPQSYQALQLNVYARSDDAIPISDEVVITINTDGVNANFDNQELEGTGAGPPTATRIQGLAGSRVIMLIPAAGEGANEFGGGVVTFPRYERTDGHKHFITLSGTNENQVILRSSRWENTAAITQIDLDPVNGVNFIAGSVFELVGVMPTQTFNIDIDGEIKGIADGNFNVPDSGVDLVIGGDATPYINEYQHTVADVLTSDIAWRYGSTFYDRSYYGVEFDGDSGDITVADDAAIQNIWDGGGTLECWINADSDGESNAGNIFNKSAAANGWYVMTLEEAGGKVKIRFFQRFDGTDGFWGTTSTEVDINMWTHLVITYDNGNVANDPILYVNGSIVALTETSTPVGTRETDVGVNLLMGTNAGGARTLDGTEDEIRLYTRILGQTEVTANYNAGVGSHVPYSTTALVGWWHMELGTGAAVTDYSGNGNDGVITTALWANGHVPLPPTETGTNPATPTFRTVSSDLDVSANMTTFQPISQAQAPAYVLGPGNPFFTDTSGNVTGNFTTVPPVGTFPLAGVITAIANATATPPQLPLLIIACFIILAASLTTSYTMRRFGSGSLMVKAFVIIGVMGVFIALGDFGIDFWMLVVFAIIATALAFASKQLGWQ